MASTDSLRSHSTKPLLSVHHGIEKEKPFTCIHNLSTTTIIMSVAVLFLFFILIE